MTAVQSFGKTKHVTCPRCGQGGSEQESGIIIHSTPMGSQWVHPSQALEIYLKREGKIPAIEIEKDGKNR